MPSLADNYHTVSGLNTAVAIRDDDFSLTNNQGDQDVLFYLKLRLLKSNSEFCSAVIDNEFYGLCPPVRELIQALNIIAFGIVYRHIFHKAHNPVC